MIRHYPLALVLALAACAPGAAEYTKAEAPDQLQVQGAESAVAVAFVPGSAQLTPAVAARLDGLVATGVIRPADRVMIAAAGPPGLAAARAAAVASRLLRWNIVAEARSLPVVPRDRALVTIGRYAVSLPPCPNWSEPRANDFTNAPPSDFGCATAVNLGLMVAHPADLTGGAALAPADGKPAVAAIDRYLDDQVQLPALVALGPIGAIPTAPPPAAPASGQGGQ